jgi:hypothetical protein
VHDQLAVREFHGVAHLVEESQALVHRDLERRAVLVDRTALHELHYDVGRPVLVDPGIVQAGDVRVLERGEDPLLEEEARPELPREHPGADELDGHAAIEAVVVPLGQIDRPHASPADLPEEPVGADPAPRRPAVVGLGVRPRARSGFAGDLPQQPGDEGPEGPLQEVVFRPAHAQGPARAEEERRILSAGAGQERVTVGGRDFERALQHPLQPLPLLAGHRVHGLLPAPARQPAASPYSAA